MINQAISPVTQPVGARLGSHGLVACLLLALALGCSNKESQVEENSWISYFNKGESAEVNLLIERDGSCSVSQSGNPGKANNAELTPDQLASVSAVMTPELFEIYRTEALADCHQTAQIPVVEEVLWREQVGNVLHLEHGCWDRTSLQRSETIEMLDLMSTLATDKLE